MTTQTDTHHRSAGPQPATGASHRPLDRRWVRLQRLVATGEVVVFVAIMLLVRGRFIPPLAIASLLFAAGATVTVRWARAGAIVVGLMSTLWLGLNIAFASQVIPDLLAIEVTEIFVPTFAMNVLAGAGVMGMVGALRRVRGGVAAVTQFATVAIVAVATVASVVAGAL